MAVSGVALAAASVGALFVYGGLKGKSPLAELQAVITGSAPGTAPVTNPIGSPSASSGGKGGASGGNPGTVSNGGSNQAILQATAAKFGWTGNQWAALQNIEMHEAGYSTTVKNGTSGALGMAQALGHGTANTAGTLGNEYGGYGMSDADARAANSGDAAAQSLWMCLYIRSKYGNPANAWAQYCSHGEPNPCWY